VGTYGRVRSDDRARDDRRWAFDALHIERSSIDLYSNDLGVPLEEVRWDWYKTARFANACGATVVIKHGCANSMSDLEEVMAFVDEHGGLRCRSGRLAG